MTTRPRGVYAYRRAIRQVRHERRLKRRRPRVIGGWVMTSWPIRREDPVRHGAWVTAELRGV